MSQLPDSVREVPHERRPRKRFAITAIVIFLIASFMAVVGAPPADAATGGGCAFSTRDGTKIWSCISAQGSTVKPDFYVDARPNCAYIVATLQVRDHRNRWYNVLTEEHDCSYGRHDVRDAYNGSRDYDYRLRVTVVLDGGLCDIYCGTRPLYSPKVYMP